MQKYKIHKIERLSGNEAEIIGEILLEFLNESRKEALKHLNEHLNLPGFRKGQIPENVLVKTVGEMDILEETAEIALGKEYPNIILESKLHPMMCPHISITKLAAGIPLEFKIGLVLEPEFELPDYKKIAREAKAQTAFGSSPDSQNKPREKDVEKRRILILDNIVKETKLELPKKFVEHEVSHLLQHFRQDLEKAGIKLEAYLGQVKKTEEEVRKSWEEEIIARTKRELIFGKIAEKENLKNYKEIFEMLEGKKEEKEETTSK